ncbi:MAG: fluoride efflux transporter CrcB [Desulfarculus sp.]|nr:fluoride efflux transporter CrcB [Desulfarculus sp.]
MQKLFYIGLAGALGTLARYGLSGWVQRLGDFSYPWGTTAVNLLGCFLFGLVWTWAEARLWFTGEMRAVVLVGFMGGFTTFSSFAFETGMLLKDSQWLMACANLVLQNLVGLVALALGWAAGKAI